MARSIVGLDIGHTGVRAVASTPGSRGKGATVTAVAAAAVTPGAVVEGEVVDVDAVATSIKDAWRGTRLGKHVAIGVSGRHVTVRQLDLPWLEPKAFRQALPYRVAGQLPVPVDELVLDYVPLGDGPLGEGGARTQRILLVAATREPVNRAVRAAQKAGLRPVRVDLSGLALLRIGAEEPLPAKAAEAIIDIGAEVSTLVIHVGGAPRFVRVLTGEGGIKITRALMDRMSLSLTEAESAKRSLGVAPAVAKQTQESWAMRAVIERVADGTIAAIRGSLDYFLANAPDVEGLGRVVLTGGGAQLPGLVARLADALGIPVLAADPLGGFRVKKKIVAAAGPFAPELATAAGLSMAEVA